MASSPVIHNGVVVIQVDVQEGSFVAAFDVKTGEELWKTPRDEVPTWGTPTIFQGGGRTQVVLNGYQHIGAYDFETGQEIWKLKAKGQGGGDIPVPTPVVSDGLVFITNSHGQAPIYAIRTGATGRLEISDEEPGLEWFHRTRGNYMQTPVVYRQYLYCCSDAGILTCYEAATGKEVYRERLGSGGSGFTSSGVAVDGKLYFASEEGEVHVIKAGPEFERLAVNVLGETFMSSPAVSEGVLFFRARNHLIAVGEL